MIELAQINHRLSCCHYQDGDNDDTYNSITTLLLKFQRMNLKNRCCRKKYLFNHYLSKQEKENNYWNLKA